MSCKRSGLQCEVVFLVAAEDELLRRFAETRRKHPMSAQRRRPARSDGAGARAARADRLDRRPGDRHLTSGRARPARHHSPAASSSAPCGRLSITFESFGFKHGIPGDADFVFDARALPNPYWEPGLRNLTGRDAEVIRFLETHTNVTR